MGQFLTKTSPTTTAASSPPPLLEPAMNGNLSQIKTLIGTHIASIDITSETTTTTNRDTTTKKTADNPALCEYVNRSDPMGNTALHGAVFNGHLPVVRFLLEQCHADIYATNDLGCGMIWLACGYNRVEVFKYLLDHIQKRVQDNTNHSNDDDGEESRREKSLEELMNEGNSTGDTPLIAAASKGNTEICKMLLDQHDDDDNTAIAMKLFQTRNNGGDTCLSVAVGGGHDENGTLDLLFEWDAKQKDDNQRLLNSKNEKGLTPLLVACERGHANIATKLVQHGALPTSDSDGKSPLAVAVFCGHLDVTENLLNLEFGKELLNTIGEGGCTPLWLASRTGNVKMIDLLLKHGADLAIVDSREGLSPKEVAIKYKKEKVVEFWNEYDLSNDRKQLAEKKTTTAIS